VISPARRVGLLTCLGLGAADLLVLNLGVMPHVESGEPIAWFSPLPDPLAARAFASAASDVNVGAVSIVERAPEPSVEAIQLPAQPEPSMVISFKSSSHRVDRRSRKRLVAELARLAVAPSIVIVGHADPSGPDEFNDRLSAARAAAVARYLRTLGVSHSRVQLDFRGAREPRADGESRRVEIYLGGAP
jgi:outer membrane protein OmpA-like peptidoglycan-associated protein